jgi:hypothetical protein
VTLFDLVDRIREKIAREGYGACTEHELVLVDVWDLEADVNNGGFDQFFFNSAGDRAAQMIAALKIIGAAQMAAIVEEACREFPDGHPAEDRVLRQEQLEPLGDGAFEALDQRFFAYPDPVERLLTSYCRKNGLIP